MEKRDEFLTLLRMLQRVVATRGGDASRLQQEYVWPSDATSAGSAVSLGSFLTGGSQPGATVPAPGRAAGFVPVPPGLGRPK